MSKAMLFRGLLVGCLVVLAAAVIGLRRNSPSAPERLAEQVKPWSLQFATTGMTFTWDRTAPELRGARRVDLILHNQESTITHSLDRPTGMLVIPFNPEAAMLSVDGKHLSLFGAQAPQAAAADTRAREDRSVERQDKVERQQNMKFLMLLSNRNRRVVSTAAVVLPRVPSYVRRSIDVDLFVKVGPKGKVASVASNYSDDPLRSRLSAVASDAVSRWQFNRVEVNSLREGRIRVIFTPKGVSIHPTG
jgi:hypothetical protein